MKYLALTVLVFLVLGLGYSLLSSNPNPQYGYANPMRTPATQEMSHTDSIDRFVNWYDNMCDTFCSITELSEFQIVGPQKNAELKERFSTWHIKLTHLDKKLIGQSFKENLRPLLVHSYNLAKESGVIEHPISNDQIEMLINLTAKRIDEAVDTTTYLDYLVKWAVENYNPPTEN